MQEFTINCPCCDNRIRILISDSGDATAFLLDKNNISNKELSLKYGIELGVAEGEVNKK